MIRPEMRKAKLAYEEKVEEEFGSMNAKDAFQHVKSMTGTDNNSNQPSPSDPIDLRWLRSVAKVNGIGR